MELKLNNLLISAYAEKLGFVQDEQSILRVILALGMSLYHFFVGKLGSHDVITLQRWFLKVQMDHSASLRRCVQSGTSWNVTSFSINASFITVAHSLSSM